MRKPMVNRTFHTTKATVLVVNLDTKQTEEMTFTFSTALKEKRDIIKACLKTDIVPSNVKVVDVISFTHETKKYAMSEETFIAHATQEN